MTSSNTTPSLISRSVATQRNQILCKKLHGVCSFRAFLLFSSPAVTTRLDQSTVSLLSSEAECGGSHDYNVQPHCYQGTHPRPCWSRHDLCLQLADNLQDTVPVAPKTFGLSAGTTIHDALNKK